MSNGVKSAKSQHIGGNRTASNGNGNGNGGRERISAYFPRKLAREIRALARLRRWDLTTAVIVACEEYCRSQSQSEAK